MSEAISTQDQEFHSTAQLLASLSAALVENTAVTQSTANRLERLEAHADVTEKRLGKLHKYIEKLVRNYHQARALNYCLPEPAFLEVAGRVAADGRTTLGHDRLYVLWQAVKNVRHLQHPAAEVGAYRGGSAYFLAAAFQHLAGRQVELHVFDTFEGHPAAKVSEADPFHQPGKFSETDYDAVQAYLHVYPEIKIHKGEFPETARDLHERTYSLVHLDTDLYQSILDGLRYFGNRLVPGGIAVVDDYGTQTCPGVAAAVAEFLLEEDNFQLWDVETEQLVMVKR